MDTLIAFLTFLSDLIMFCMAMAITLFVVAWIVEVLTNSVALGVCIWAFLWAAAFSWHEAVIR